jgi:hypothetical protein
MELHNHVGSTGETVCRRRPYVVGCMVEGRGRPEKEGKNEGWEVGSPTHECFAVFLEGLSRERFGENVSRIDRSVNLFDKNVFGDDGIAKTMVFGGDVSRAGAIGFTSSEDDATGVVFVDAGGIIVAIEEVDACGEGICCEERVCAKFKKEAANREDLTHDVSESNVLSLCGAEGNFSL